MFLDDIVDTVKDAASTVGKVGLEVAGVALSPMESITMQGLGAAMSTVKDVFGDVDLFDSVSKGGLPTEFLDGAASFSGKILGDNGAAGGFAADIAKVFTGSDSNAAAELSDKFLGDGGQSAKTAFGIGNFLGGDATSMAGTIAGEVMGDDGQAFNSTKSIANLFNGQNNEMEASSMIGGKLLGEDSNEFAILNGVGDLFTGKKSVIGTSVQAGDAEFGQEVESFIQSDSISKRIKPENNGWETAQATEATARGGSNMSKVNRAFSRFM